MQKIENVLKLFKHLDLSGFRCLHFDNGHISCVHEVEEREGIICKISESLCLCLVFIFAFKFQFCDCSLCSDHEDLRGDLLIERTLSVSCEPGAVLDLGSRGL